MTSESIMTIFISGMGLILITAALLQKMEAERHKKGSFYGQKARLNYCILGIVGILMLLAVPLKLLIVGP